MPAVSETQYVSSVTCTGGAGYPPTVQYIFRVQPARETLSFSLRKKDLDCKISKEAGWYNHKCQMISLSPVTYFIVDDTEAELFLPPLEPLPAVLSAFRSVDGPSMREDNFKIFF